MIFLGTRHSALFFWHAGHRMRLGISQCLPLYSNKRTLLRTLSLSTALSKLSKRSVAFILWLSLDVISHSANLEYLHWRHRYSSSLDTRKGQNSRRNALFCFRLTVIALLCRFMLVNYSLFSAVVHACICLNYLGRLGLYEMRRRYRLFGSDHSFAGVGYRNRLFIRLSSPLNVESGQASLLRLHSCARKTIKLGWTTSVA